MNKLNWQDSNIIKSEITQPAPFLLPSSSCLFHSTKMSSNENLTKKPIRSDPIPIITRHRPRSVSISSTSSSSVSSSDAPATPASPSMSSQRINITSPSTSPILSYFLAQSPTKTPTFPLKRKFGTTPMFEGDSQTSIFSKMNILSHSQ